ncbi:MAG: pyridoxamine 5'-phosphate oxidase family protein [Pseudomonadota bacterium]
MNEDLSTERTRLRREHQKGRYDRANLYAVLDSTPLCHVGYVVDGQPFVTPTLQWRDGDYIYWHGSSKSRALKAAVDASVCITVTRLDGMVLARSAYHHSANFASAMIFGVAERVEAPDRKKAALRTMVEGLYPGRWEELRPVTAFELKATLVLRARLDEASVKLRQGEVLEEEADADWPVWAGVVPLSIDAEAPAPDRRNRHDLETPQYLRQWKLARPGGESAPRKR